MLTEQGKGSPDRKEIDQPLCRAYHWTSAYAWKKITRGGNLFVDRNGKASGQERGIWPRRNIFDYNYASEFPPAFFREKGPYSFAFINSPNPPEWQKYPDIYNEMIFRRIKDDPVLLSFNVYPNDNPSVLELGHLIRGIEDRERNITSDKNHVAYFDSAVPLKDYRGNFLLPELILPDYIELSRIRREPLSEFFEYHPPVVNAMRQLLEEAVAGLLPTDKNDPYSAEFALLDQKALSVLTDYLQKNQLLPSDTVLKNAVVHVKSILEDYPGIKPSADLTLFFDFPELHQLPRDETIVWNRTPHLDIAVSQAHDSFAYQIGFRGGSGIGHAARGQINSSLYQKIEGRVEKIFDPFSKHNEEQRLLYVFEFVRQQILEGNATRGYPQWE